jgi:hypothetical protein
MVEVPQKTELGADAVLFVFRLVTTDQLDVAALEPSFYSNQRKGKRPKGREVRCPEIWGSLSVYKSLQGARDLYRVIAKRQRGAVRIGEHVAELRLEGGVGFVYEEQNRADGHVSLWGEPLDLAARVVDIHPADPDQQMIFKEIN